MGTKAETEAVSSAGSSASLPELRRIELGKDYRGIGALAFSPEGKLLVAVTLDNFHSVLVFDWRAGVALSEGRGFAGEPPQVIVRPSLDLHCSEAGMVWSYTLQLTQQQRTGTCCGSRWDLLEFSFAMHACSHGVSMHPM